MINSNWISLKPEISMYEVIRNSKQDNEFNLEGLMYPNGNSKDDMCSSDDGAMALSKDSFRDTSANFKNFMDNVRQLDVALTANAEKNDAYYTNLHVKYRRTLSVQDIEAMFSVLLASHKISKKSKRNWTDEEILLLIYFVRFYCLGHELTPITMTEDDWWVIAKLLPRRAADVTKDKWMSLHHIHIHDAPWTTEEDNHLMTLIQRFGLKKWTAIARELNKFAKNSLVFRQGKQCRERWINHLDPSINKGSWTPEEDIKLLKAVTELGKKWSEIAKLISNRTENAVKNRWKSLIKKHRFEFNAAATGNNNSAAFERVMTQIVLQMRVKESNDMPANAMTTQGTTTTHPISEMESPIHEDEQVDWLLDNIDEEIEVKSIPDSMSKRNEYPTDKKCLAESSNIKLLNSLFAGDNNCGARPVSTIPVGISSNNAFPELRMDRVVSTSETAPAGSPKHSNKNVEFHSINELDDMKELENLEVCLYNGSKKVVYKASDLVQKKVLHNFIMSMISLEDAKRDTFASLLNNTTSAVEPEVKVEAKVAPKPTAMTNEVKSGMTFQQLINSSRSSNLEAGRLFNMTGSNGMHASNGMMLASNGMMRASQAMFQSNGMMNESMKSSRGGSEVFHGFAHRAPSEFFNFEEEFHDKAKGNLLNSALSSFLDNEESPFFRNIKESVTPYFK